MKLFYNFLCVLAACCFTISSTSVLAQTSGGPDGYGYTWINSDDPEGPAFEWIDITQVGTEVEGLVDDNSVPFISMGLDFQFYWISFDRIKIGSNGWLSFNNVANIAACFDPVPGPEYKNVIGPMIGDLNFAGGGNPGKIYTYNDGNGKFIISYHNVPFWVNSPPNNFQGDNTFQVILDNADTSIVFNYLDVDNGTVDNNANCGELIVGISNITGNEGFSIFEEMTPPDSFSIRIDYPEEVLLSIADPTPSWNIDESNAGVFFLPEDDIAISTGLTNSGNLTSTDDITLQARVQRGSLPIYIENQTFIGELAPGATEVVDFPLLTAIGTDNTPGVYSARITTSSTGDANPTNNQNISEFSVLNVSPANPEIMFSYTTSQTSDGDIRWNGGGGNSGMAIYIKPPSYPAVITAVECFVIGDQAGAMDDAYTIQILDENGEGGSPGNILSIDAVEGGSFDVAGAWVRTELLFPVTITEGGFYASWVMTGNSVSIGTEGFDPISRRSFEYISGQYAPYRQNSNTDIMIRVFTENDFFVNVDDVALDNGIKVFPNPTNRLVSIENNVADQTISKITVFNTLGQQVVEKNVAIIGTDTYQLDLNQLSSGIYYLNLSSETAQTSKKIFLQK